MEMDLSFTPECSEHLRSHGLTVTFTPTGVFPLLFSLPSQYAALVFSPKNVPPKIDSGTVFKEHMYADKRLREKIQL